MREQMALPVMSMLVPVPHPPPSFGTNILFRPLDHLASPLYNLNPQYNSVITDEWKKKKKSQRHNTSKDLILRPINKPLNQTSTLRSCNVLYFAASLNKNLPETLFSDYIFCLISQMVTRFPRFDYIGGSWWIFGLRLSIMRTILKYRSSSQTPGNKKLNRLTPNWIKAVWYENWRPDLHW